MSERDFEVGGREFKLSKMDTLRQFHVVRRLGPILGDIIPVAQKVNGLIKGKSEGMSEEAQFQAIAELAAPVLDGFAKLSDEDANFVLHQLCSCVEMKQQPLGNWARVSTGTMMMIQDLELPVMLQIAGRAFAHNLAGFFALAPQTSHGGK